MIATRIFRLLLVALSILAAAEAVSPRQGVPVGIRGAINVRQEDSSSGTSRDTQDATSSNPSPTGNTNTRTSATPSPTDDNTSPTQTNTRTTPTTTETKTTPTDNPATRTTPTSTETTPTSTADNNDDNTTPTATEASQTTPTTYTTVVIMTTTNANGDAQVFTTSSIATGTLATSTSSSENKGMSANTRNTIIGVVVGVGGAIILAVVGLIWWRVWGRKKNHEENDGLMGYGGYTAGAAEKPESLTGGHTGTMGSGSSRTPFQSTLESYHAPTQVNQASNF